MHLRVRKQERQECLILSAVQVKLSLLLYQENVNFQLVMFKILEAINFRVEMKVIQSVGQISTHASHSIHREVLKTV